MRNIKLNDWNVNKSLKYNQYFKDLWHRHTKKTREHLVCIVFRGWEEDDIYWKLKMINILIDLCYQHYILQNNIKQLIVSFDRMLDCEIKLSLW